MLRSESTEIGLERAKKKLRESARGISSRDERKKQLGIAILACFLLGIMCGSSTKSQEKTSELIFGIIRLIL